MMDKILVGKRRNTENLDLLNGFMERINEAFSKQLVESFGFRYDTKTLQMLWTDKMGAVTKLKELAFKELQTAKSPAMRAYCDEYYKQKEVEVYGCEHEFFCLTNGFNTHRYLDTKDLFVDGDKIALKGFDSLVDKLTNIYIETEAQKEVYDVASALAEEIKKAQAVFVKYNITSLIGWKGSIIDNGGDIDPNVIESMVTK